jgi:hypothetical protein
MTSIQVYKIYDCLNGGEGMMGTVICQNCNSTIDHFEDEKVTVLYSKCKCCDNNVNKVESKNN